MSQNTEIRCFTKKAKEVIISIVNEQFIKINKKHDGKGIIFVKIFLEIICFKMTFLTVMRPSPNLIL